MRQAIGTRVTIALLAVDLQPLRAVRPSPLCRGWLRLANRRQGDPASRSDTEGARADSRAPHLADLMESWVVGSPDSQTDVLLTQRH